MVEFDAAEIAHGVGELYDPLADEKGLALKVEAPARLPVRGNRELVTQALANLVDNAIKYAAPACGEANGSARRIWWSRRAARATASAQVSDRGPGIPEGDRERVVAALRAAGAEPLAAGLGAGLESRGGGRASARRRTAP